jgi:hypothetical protein
MAHSSDPISTAVPALAAGARWLQSWPRRLAERCRAGLCDFFVVLGHARRHGCVVHANQEQGQPNAIFKGIAGPRIASEVAAVFRRYEKSPMVKQLIEQMTRTAPAAKAQSAL